MKKINKLILSLISITSLSACTRIADNSDDKPYYDCTYVETQYRLNFAFRSSYYEGDIYVYKDAKSLKNNNNSATPYYWWNLYQGLGKDFGEYQNYDPFEKYDDAFFENHVLFLTILDLNPEGEIYYISLDTELTQSKTDEKDVYYYLNYYIVYPEKTDKVYSSVDKKCTYVFFEIETDNPSETYTKYTVDPVYYYRWTIYKSDFPNYFNYQKTEE